MGEKVIRGDEVYVVDMMGANHVLNFVKEFYRADGCAQAMMGYLMILTE
ncbi:hypothetical protein PITCH_A1010021 [uncultured Desulfobacterium sp.]|uniref:Uncharacterized protein n=1 Tax=uncultured Desulfobacterium sp. TaxID=201089 RepID=A0A445MQM9_9BACT|nr:hypothetical protein PITCH_A1010021 [uncultured Desulfobacterium sp.]